MQGKIEHSWNLIFKHVFKACAENWPMWNEVEARLTPAETSKLGTNLSKYQVSLTKIFPHITKKFFRQISRSKSLKLPQPIVQSISRSWMRCRYWLLIEIMRLPVWLCQAASGPLCSDEYQFVCTVKYYYYL